MSDNFNHKEINVKPLSSIFAPQVVAVPPTFAVRDLCRTADGELRHLAGGISKSGSFSP
jgi:hypothetical protein